MCIIVWDVSLYLQLRSYRVSTILGNMWSTILNLFIYFLIMTILNYLRHLTLNYNITLTANLNPSNDQYTFGPYIFKHMLPPHHHVLRYVVSQRCANIPYTCCVRVIPLVSCNTTYFVNYFIYSYNYQHFS